MDGNNQPTILLVDDCPANRRLCERLLQQDGFAVAHAANGAEAIETARTMQPHVIVMDIMMPVMDGLDATRALRQDPMTSRIPIIILSAKAEEEDLAAGLTAGANEYIFKPIRGREFRLRVRSMVHLRQAQLETERANTSLQRRTELLAKLNQFAEAVLTENAVEATCRRIVETAAQLLRSDRVSLLVPDSSGRSLRFAYAVGMKEEQWRDLAVPLHRSIAGKVFTTQREVVVGAGERRPPPLGTYASESFASMPLICTPLRAEEGAIGVLNITENQWGGDYGPEDVETLRQFAQTAALALNNALTRRKLDATRDSIIFSMAKLSEYRHSDTGKHLERVQELSALLARQLATDPRIPEKIDEPFISNLRRAAPLHDIGKVGIPDRILLKPGKLTDEEFRLMQAHTRTGAETLQSVIASGHDAGFLKIAMDIAHYHHERYDGTGYPAGLAGEQIPLSARIVCLADTYDAIRVEREYKPARSHDEAAREILRMSGRQFDPQVVQAFCAVQEAFCETFDRHAEQDGAQEDAERAAPLAV